MLRHVDFSALVSSTEDITEGEEKVQVPPSSSSRKRPQVLFVRAWKGHVMPVLCMACDPTGTLVATGSADRSVRVWDIKGGYCTHSFREHSEIVSTVMFHPDPYRLLLFSSSSDCYTRVWDLHDHNKPCSAAFSNHVSPPTDLALSDDGYLLVTAGRDKVCTYEPYIHCFAR